MPVAHSQWLNDLNNVHYGIFHAFVLVWYLKETDVELFSK